MQHFTKVKAVSRCLFSGLDLTDLGTVIAIRENEDIDVGRKATQMRKFLTKWQEDFNQIEKVINVMIMLTFNLLEPKVIGLCHQYRARPACTSVQSDHALYCWKCNFCILVLYF
jgi:hypothetical protein